MKIITFYIFLFLSFSALGSIHEKSLIFSGQWVALGGAASSLVTGADGVLFNPAGVARGAEKEIALHFSPSLSQFKPRDNLYSTPHYSQNQEEENDDYSFFFAALSSLEIGSNLFLGAGLYTATETKINQNLTNQSHQGLRNQFYLKIWETSLALSYQLSPQLSLGASWRGLIASGRLIKYYPTNTFSTEDNYPELQSPLSHGFRVGVQYQNKKRNLGGSFVLRGPVDFQLESRLARTCLSPDVIESPDSEKYEIRNTELETQLPTQFTFGLYWKPHPRQTFLHETSLTQSRNNRRIHASNGTGQASCPPPAGTQPWPLPITQNWRNRWDLRFGYQNLLADRTTLRLGYSFNTSVAPEENYTNTLSPSPAGFHNFSFGAGQELLADHLFVDLAFEYSTTFEQLHEDGSRIWALHSSLRHLF